MKRIGWILVIVILLGSGCAKRATTGSGGAAAPAPAPFTNQELVSELRAQGVGRAGGAGAAEGLTEITETSRGVVITLPSTFFAFDRFDLDPQARQAVDRIAQVLKNPRAVNRTIKLEGHTDNVGTAAYNRTLSKKRVEAVAKELAERGVPANRIATEAFGETRPVAPNRKPDGSDDPAARAKNRRVEAIIPNQGPIAAGAPSESAASFIAESGRIATFERLTVARPRRAPPGA
jgi:outer membrane protein OmpA-like peptidoglycan-associated protein